MVAPTRRSKATPNRQDFELDAHPSEQELISSYLTPRVVDGDKSCRFIHNGDVYAAHPADITREYAPAVSSNGDEAWYFFTAVRARGGGRKARTLDLGEGCWHSEAGSKPVVSAHHGGVGYRQNFSFVTKEDGARVRSGWLMVELGLHDDGQDEVTLCKVYFSPRAAAKKPAASARKRKADAPAPAHQCHRRARQKTSGSDTDQDEHPAENGDHAKAGKQEGLVEPEVEVEDRTCFYWWLRNKDTVRVEAGMSKEHFYTLTARSPFEDLFNKSNCRPRPVVRREDQPVIMYATYDELYDLPIVKEWLAKDKILEEMRILRAKTMAKTASRSIDD
ncbi:unnamed protein product [Alopecurus aequalis]